MGIKRRRKEEGGRIVNTNKLTRRVLFPCLRGMVFLGGGVSSVSFMAVECYKDSFYCEFGWIDLV